MKKNSDGRKSSQNNKTNLFETKFYVKYSRKKNCVRLQGQRFEGLSVDNGELFHALE